MEYSGMSDDDLGSLIVYLESLPKVDRAILPVHQGPIGRALVAAKKMPIAAALIDHHNVAASDVPHGINPTYGRYLAVGCVGCHNPSFSGGKIEQGPPDWPPASNLTAGAGSAVAQWSKADFITTLRTRRRPNGTKLHATMPKSFGQLDDVELKAIWSFLKTVSPKAIGQHD
jgi:mono/diheme cytochrome c family protein